MNTVTLESLTGWGNEAVRSIPVTGTVSGKKTARRLSAAVAKVIALSRSDTASAWYADNEYLVRREGALAAQAFRRTRRLRRTGTEESAVVVLCRRFVETGPVTEERLEAFLTGARQNESLPETEAVLVGDALRMAVISALAEGAETENAAVLFTDLRTLAELDLTDALERSDPVDRLLRSDPVYPTMDRDTRAMYRASCQQLAEKHGSDALKEAQTALQNGLHETLTAQPEHTGTGYMSACFALTALFCGALWLLSGHFWCLLIGLVPCHALACACVDRLVSRFVKPRRLPRLALESGVPPEGRTLCAVFALLTSDETAPNLLRRMEQYRLAGRDCGSELLFALVADLPEGKNKEDSAAAARLRIAAEQTDRLNQTYGGGFFLLSRDRVFVRSDGVYMPWERKRGAMVELCRTVTGAASSLRCLAGDESALHAGYILCLDSDTRLLPGSARSLIGAALHPANRPVIENGLVVKGHGLIHPRMSPELPGTLATDFSRLYAGQGGTDPYALAAGDLFFDLFSQGGFTGKGILDANAYLTCTADFPENRILSHDAPEGARLRGAYMGDVELTDNSPVTGSGWFRRLERWTRGDWQNLPWIFSRKAHLPVICRFRLAENLTRSLTAPLCLVCLVLNFFLAVRPLAATALICLGFEALTSAVRGLFLPAEDARIRCRSAVLRGTSGAITRFLTRVLFLPWESFCLIGGILSALWRSCVSHRRMLAWSPAGDTGSPLSLSLLLSSLLGLLLLIFAPGPLGKALGGIWLFLPLLGMATGKRTLPKNLFTASDRRFLLRSAEAIWTFFTDNCTRRTHWLPPDNVQIQPPKGAAPRTSPTNIGMAFASAVAAAELELTTKEQAAGFIERLLSTVERLPKWHGHLFNWYDITTCAPLQPPYISSVDSGNLCACLLCAANAMKEYGQEDLAHRLRFLADETDFSQLYDDKRRLFRIGLDPVTGKFSPGYYDLMASEALLTSYLTCARGAVPVRHWQALSRTRLSLDGWQGLASWSGSMFEYLMPALFLPLTEGSSLWESARFCVYAQRRRGRRTGAPWGCSESGFYSLDASMDYRYKAHGVGALALRRDMDSELVIAPYASFLALCVHPKSAVMNLRRLKRRDMWGRYGLYEALDMTPGRCVGKGSPVASYMCHHLGMSLCAAANALKGGCMRRHFLADPSLAAYTPLLSERVPLSGPVLHRTRHTEHQEAAAGTEHPILRCTGEGYDPDAPAVFPLSNGVYSLLAGTDGTCRALVGGILLYTPDGLDLRVNDTPLTPAQHRARFLPWCYEGGQLTFSAPGSSVAGSCSLAVASGETAELRRIVAPGQSHLTIRFSPVLARPSDYAAHPAFRRLGLEVTTRAGAVFVRRLARDDLPELWLCMAATVRLTVTEGLGWQMDSPVTVSAQLPEGGCAGLALCFARSREEASAGARRALSGGTGDMAGTMASLLGMNTAGLTGSLSLCSDLIYPRVQAKRDSRRAELWAHGLSGDLPILYVPVGEDLTAAKRAIKQHALLTACGVSFDLVLADGEDADYDKPRRRVLESYLDRYSLTPFLDTPGGIRFRTGDDIAAASVRPHSRESHPVATLPALSRTAERNGESPVPMWHSDGSFSFDTPPLPPRAWCSILTNGHFGFLSSDSGTGFLWFENARECPISPWCNDPLATVGGETLECIGSDGRVGLFADGKSRCHVVHGFGWTRWEHPHITVTVCVPPDANARILFIEGGEDTFIGWHLPLALCPETSDVPFVITGCEDGCLTAVNPHGPYPDRVFRAVSNKPLSGFTCHEPSWLRGRLDGRAGSGLEPCFGALYKGGGSTVIVCGFEDTARLRALCDVQTAAKTLLRTRDNWRSILGRLRLRTPDKDLDRYMNGWAAYQTLACRILGRTSMYQCGGAYGFRDQLQDVTNLIFILPSKARSHILTCCARQFREGDVLHWWHETPEGVKGVRTRCSDDLLWLAWALCEYTEMTGDRSLHEETAPWLEAAPLQDSEYDRYFAPPVTGSATVLEHARRALTLTLERGTGPHGLLLTGSGDWNDGMDKVGGESVWLTWFFVTVALRFDALLSERGDPEAGFLTERAKDLAAACESTWDGSWYLRGFWADGTPLGAAGAEACAIDSLAQSWAAFCPLADRNHVRTALLAAYDRLYDPAHGITKLFTPPFGDTGADPGYIRACGPGFRENGGQYTHGAIWLASALLKEGFTEEGTHILLDLLPGKHAVRQWRAEPYVLAADVSSNPDHYGQALWSWYTGSAGWFLRVVLEDLLGMTLKGSRLTVAPQLPKGWDGYEATVAGRHISVKNGVVTELQ